MPPEKELASSEPSAATVGLPIHDESWAPGGRDVYRKKAGG
jgi:hypothetical protein